MGHSGEKLATFPTGKGQSVMSLGFLVSEVQKPLAAVWRIAVQHGPRDEDNDIQNVETKKKI